MEGRRKKIQKRPNDWWIRLKASLPNRKNGIIYWPTKPFSGPFLTAPAAGLLADRQHTRNKKKK
jgi:hypothetical protein